MNSEDYQISYLVKPLPIYFLVGLILVNFIAIFPQYDFLYIGSLFAFLYIIITPGFLMLPFFSAKKIPPMLGIAFSVALSLLTLMLLGLAINTVLPFYGMHQPLTTAPLLIAFDVLIYLLLILNFSFKKNSPFEFHEFSAFNWLIAILSFLLPVLACLGAIVLNNNGSDFLTMLALLLAAIIIAMLVLKRTHVSPSTPPLALYFMALSFLLMNSMRGWFVTGHDILLEYHVFTITNTAHLWNMAFFQDPYMACLSLTILPTYLESLIHVNTGYIFKFFTQFLGAIPVVLVYYLAKQYVSEKIALLCGFLYITFPTFMVDMAFLNRQGIAFIFFGSLLFIIFTTDYITGWKRYVTMFLLGTGVILSHYSTSYVAMAVLAIAYVVNRILRWIMNAEHPQWLFRLTNKFGNKSMYSKPILLPLAFVIGFFAIGITWAGPITHTSVSVVDTIQQIIVSVEHPFSIDESTGPAKYSLVVSEQPTPQQLLDEFKQTSIQQDNVEQYPDSFYPLSVTESYPTTPIAEIAAPITSFGQKFQSLVHTDLWDFYNDVKQVYAKILQILLLIGLLGLIFGYSFKKNIIRDIPVEYIAFSIAGIGVLAGQTLLPADAVDYGLLRLFQQNLIFLALPIMLGLICIIGLIFKDHTKQVVISLIGLLLFYFLLSGFFPQFTGGGRPPLPLDNSGLYYDSYYTHAQEVYSAEWLAENGNLNLPVQAAHFSDIKMLAYGHIEVFIALLPETTERDAYVYLNYDNVKTSNILEIVNGDVVYYHFPMNFLESNKNLIYNNGGSEIYR